MGWFNDMHKKQSFLACQKTKGTSSFLSIFEGAAEKFVNDRIKKLYPQSWVECKRCGRALKNDDALKEHVRMEHLKGNIERVFIESSKKDLSFDDSFIHIVTLEADKKLLSDGFWAEYTSGIRTLL